MAESNSNMLQNISIFKFYSCCQVKITPTIKSFYPVSSIISIFLCSMCNLKWASSRENLSSGVCEQQKRLCVSLIEKYNI